MPITVVPEDTTENPTRSRRAGLIIPDAWFAACEDSYVNAKSKRVVVKDDEVADARSLINSLHRRYGYNFTSDIVEAGKGKKAVRFRVDDVDERHADARAKKLAELGLITPTS